MGNPIPWNVKYNGELLPTKSWPEPIILIIHRLSSKKSIKHHIEAENTRCQFWAYWAFILESNNTLNRKWIECFEKMTEQKLYHEDFLCSQSRKKSPRFHVRWRKMNQFKWNFQNSPFWRFHLCDIGIIKILDFVSGPIFRQNFDHIWPRKTG